MEASVTAPGQAGSPPASAAGQGDPAAAGAKAEGFWGNFPNVPEEQRSLLEPHLKDVQGYVTKLEQAHAPFKPLAEQGYTPEQVQGVITFAQQFDQDPVGTWLELATRLQEAGQLHEDLDVQAVAAAAKGEPDPDEGALPEMGEGQTEEGEVDPTIAALQQQVQQLQQSLQGQEDQRRQATEQALLQRSIGQVKEALTAAGITDELLGDGADQSITAALIANQGDVAQAAQQFVAFRDAVSKGGIPSPDPDAEGEGPNMPKGVPKPKGSKTKKKGDSFSEASAGAKNMLERRAEASAQEGS